MTPEQFTADVLPAILASWRSGCFCAEPGFLKLVSFNFEDYDAAPMALVDSEIFGEHIIRANFSRAGQGQRSSDGEILQRYVCPQCGTNCVETYTEYSISMYRSFFEFLGPAAPAPLGLYLVGARAFSLEDFQKVSDFREAASTSEFLRTLGVADPGDPR